MSHESRVVTYGRAGSGHFDADLPAIRAAIESATVRAGRPLSAEEVRIAVADGRRQFEKRQCAQDVLEASARINSTAAHRGELDAVEERANGSATDRLRERIRRAAAIAAGAPMLPTRRQARLSRMLRGA